MASTVNFGTQRNFGFNPRTIPGCVLWLDAADSNTITTATGVSQWNDKSGNDNHAVQATGSLQPTYASSAVTFNGTSQYMTLSTPSILPSGATPLGTYFFVTRLTSSGAVRAFFMYGPNTLTTGANPQFYYNASSQLVVDTFGAGGTTDSLNVLNARTLLSSTISNAAGTGTVTGWRNGTSFGPTTYTTASITSQQGLIGVTKSGAGAGSLTFYHIGDINEIVIYNQVLSTLQRQQVEGYLAWKWGIQANLPVGHGFQTKPTTMRAFQPTDIANCILWLDGADASKVGVSGANVTAWNDKSGLGNNLTTISATRPTYSSTTGAITFTSQNLTAIRGALTGGPYSNPISTFVVCSITSNTNATFNPRLLVFGTNGTSSTIFAGQANFLMNANTGSTPAFITYANNGGNPTLQGVNIQTYVPTTFSTVGIFENLSTYSGTTLTNNTFLNGNTSTYSAVNTTWTVAAPYVTSMAYVSLGNYTDGSAVAGDCFSGAIYEVIVFSRNLSTSERQQIEGYLASKWNISSLLPTTQPYYLRRALPSTSI